ncbi:sugar kinase [Marinoscillum furvescens]|uniref:2-dehydro-3-deoxygluconokinase n=1 Tax=Marinoscillum furvescens DSM 4134 TaxID=1122208 RepID=A0A3D9L0X4_MARFU|nr:sugar kinase [Marinoscillum furvescens]RED97393.1 2-dehydro-3-deoxygluconokinase [Marinoscillum furvescens DSM 4134]
MKRVVTFGEVMMRLSPPGYAKFSQTNTLDVVYGGGEANVAISLAYLGVSAAHVTRFPDNLLGRSAEQFLRHHWLDTSAIIYGDHHMGKYFLEKGAVHRGSQVVYERDGSAFAKIEPGMVDWSQVLDGADWFHWTGITPAVSAGAAACCQEAIAEANKRGITVSADIHSRKSLWNYGKAQQEIMPELIAGSDVVIGSEYDVSEIFGEPITGEGNERFRIAAEKLTKLCPRIQKVFDKNREMVSASHNRIQGKLWNGKEFLKTTKLDVTHIVDRVGTGDAYAAGIIYGLLHYAEDIQALKFATAACALKHTVEGDANMVSLEVVQNVMEGNTSGKISR